VRLAARGARAGRTTRTSPHAGRGTQSELMADLNIQKKTTAETTVAGEDYDNWEIALWLVGILCIPLVPILMVVFLTPWSGL
jgi:hypothetical protein